MHAILPESLLDTPLRGAASNVVFIDPMGRFRASRLAEFMLHHVTSTLEAAGGHDVSTDESVKREVLVCVREALEHVHVFRPAGWEELVATLDGLPGYLFNDDYDHGGDHTNSDDNHEPLRPRPRHSSTERTPISLIQKQYCPPRES